MDFTEYAHLTVAEQQELRSALALSVTLNRMIQLVEADVTTVNHVLDQGAADAAFLQSEVTRIRQTELAPLQNQADGVRKLISELETRERTRAEDAERRARQSETANRINASWWLFSAEIDRARKVELSKEVLDLCRANRDCLELVAWDKVDRVGLAAVLLDQKEYEKILADPSDITDAMSVLKCLEDGDLVEDPRLTDAMKSKLALCKRYKAHSDWRDSGIEPLSDLEDLLS